MVRAGDGRSALRQPVSKGKFVATCALREWDHASYSWCILAVKLQLCISFTCSSVAIDMFQNYLAQWIDGNVSENVTPQKVVIGAFAQRNKTKTKKLHYPRWRFHNRPKYPRQKDMWTTRTFLCASPLLTQIVRMSYMGTARLQ